MRVEVKELKRIPYTGYKATTVLHYKPWLRKPYSVEKQYLSSGGVVWYEFDTCKKVPVLGVIAKTLEDYVRKQDIFKLKKEAEKLK